MLGRRAVEGQVRRPAKVEAKMCFRGVEADAILFPIIVGFVVFICLHKSGGNNCF